MPGKRHQAPYICKTLSDGPGEPPGKTAFQVPVARPNMVDPDIALERQVMGFTDTRDDVAGHAAEFKRDLPGCVSDTTGQHILARPPVQEGIASILCLMDKQESGPVRRKPPGRRRFRSDLSASPHRRLSGSGLPPTREIAICIRTFMYPEESAPSQHSSGVFTGKASLSSPHFPSLKKGSPGSPCGAAIHALVLSAARLRLLQFFSLYFHSPPPGFRPLPPTPVSFPSLETPSPRRKWSDWCRTFPISGLAGR